MTTVSSITSAHKIRRRVMLATIIAMAGCIDTPSRAVADDTVSTPSYITFRELFENESKTTQAVEATPLDFELSGNEGLGEPSLVSYLQQDPASGVRSDNQDDQAASDRERADEDDDDSEELATEKPEGDRLGGESIFGGDALRSPSVENGRFALPPFMVASTQTSEIGNGRTPEGFRGDDPQLLELLPESGLSRSVDWDWTVRTWAAPNTFSHPRYFEDRMLERHGHERFPCLQPLASGARFFATIPMLPYLAAVRDPWDCEYTLGYYRAGSCAPALLQRPPYMRKAVIAEAAAVTTAVLVLP